jgi:hypothetical protein
MSRNFRTFEVTDPFGRTWNVEFRWQQNAISIRHSDSVDCKYYISQGDEKREVVIALLLPDLEAVAAAEGREVTDAWCTRLASTHLERTIATWDDMERPIVTVPRQELTRVAEAIRAADREERERAALVR